MDIDSLKKLARDAAKSVTETATNVVGKTGEAASDVASQASSKLADLKVAEKLGTAGEAASNAASSAASGVVAAGGRLFDRLRAAKNAFAADPTQK